MAVTMSNNNHGLMTFGLQPEDDNLIWYELKNQEGDNAVSNIKFRDGMKIIPKLLKVLNITVSDLKYINNSKTFLIKSEKKNRDKLKNIKNLGNIKCHIVDCVNKNSTKGIVHHPSFEDTNDQELLNDLQEDNENILSVHIFNRKINGISVNSQTALITFDSTELPKQIKYLSFNILKTKTYYPNPMRCAQCFQYEHFHSAEKPCTFQKICGYCSQPYRLNNPADKCENSINCVNCQGPHEAWSRKCPEYQNQTRYVEVMIDNRCSFKDAKNIVEKKEPQKYNKVAATPQPNAENTDMRELKLQIVTMTTKMEIMCNLIQTLIKEQRKFMVVPEKPTSTKLSEMEVVSDTDSAEEDAVIDSTPNQPTVSDMKTYYTVDYTKGGNNNPPPHNKRQATEKIKDKEKKKKKEKQ